MRDHKLPVVFEVPQVHLQPLIPSCTLNEGADTVLERLQPWREQVLDVALKELTLNL